MSFFGPGSWVLIFGFFLGRFDCSSFPFSSVVGSGSFLFFGLPRLVGFLVAFVSFVALVSSLSFSFFDSDLEDFPLLFFFISVLPDSSLEVSLFFLDDFFFLEVLDSEAESSSFPTFFDLLFEPFFFELEDLVLLGLSSLSSFEKDTFFLSSKITISYVSIVNNYILVLEAPLILEIRSVLLTCCNGVLVLIFLERLSQSSNIRLNSTLFESLNNSG